MLLPQLAHGYSVSDHSYLMSLYRLGVKDIVFPNKKKMCFTWLEGFTASTAM